MPDQPGQQREVPPFDPSKPHHAHPRIRPTVTGNPMPMNTPQGQQVMLALGDRAQIADGQLVTSPLAQFMLPHMDGSHDAASIASAAAEQARGAGAPDEAVVHLTEQNVQVLVAQLDAAGLLQGPVFDEKLAKLRTDFDNSDILPPGTTIAMAEALVQHEQGEGVSAEEKKRLAPQKLRESMDQWMTQVMEPLPDPSFDALPRLILAPHLDYWRGQVNYCHVYARMRVVDRPARVVILGPNHFGFGTGVVGCNKGYETPLGICEHDAEFASILERHLGADGTEKLYKDRYDHEREHSIELQLPWVQHVFADDSGATPKVYAALVHDPSRNNGDSYDGQGLGIQPFIDALRAAIKEAPGRTLVIVAADLSHVGPAFGDRVQIMGDTEEAQSFRKKVMDHDREMIALLEQGKPEQIVASMAWQQNPTRWNAVGPIVAGWSAVDATEARLLNYMAAGDQQGQAVITTAAMAVL
jgi:AmmeMemoRadiSam system protein B